MSVPSQFTRVPKGGLPVHRISIVQVRRGRQGFEAVEKILKSNRSRAGYVTSAFHPAEE